MKKIAARFRIRGIVQGVGFRPFLYREALALGMSGTLQNRGDHVQAVLEGESAALDQLVQVLSQRAPAQARIDSIERREEEPTGVSGLTILPSDGESVQDLGIPLDLAPCAKCWEEYSNPSSRRYRYPFLSCTDCGPRYTVVRGLPYDRKNTAFAPFSFCPDCAAEYADPAHRRFHAETTACAKCGPRLELRAQDGSPLPFSELSEIESEVHRRLRAGEILALKGVGGFQLIVDARNAEAVARLRVRKRRPDQAFAVMARDLAAVSRVCELGGETSGAESEDALSLASQAAPMIILPVTPQARAVLPLEVISPDSETLGVLLPSTPVHQLLFGVSSPEGPEAFDYLIATSGNAHGSPLCRNEAEVVEKLGGVIDFILTYNREIERRCDDSVWISARRGASAFRQVWRVGRGCGPQRWVRKGLENSATRTVLALGGDLKNTLALAYGNRVVLSPHIGNLSHYETYRLFERTARAFPDLIGKTPDIVVVDQHPQYSSSVFGKKLAEEKGIPCIEVQHHHAHAVACLEENQLTQALALVYDGTGFGSDGTLWGGELLQVDRKSFTRLGRLRPVALTGGDSAVVQPWKQAATRLFEAGVAQETVTQLLARQGVGSEELKQFRKIWERGLNSLPTSSMGRVFDAVAALAGIVKPQITYEGQAAIRLETQALRAGFGRGIRFESYSYRIQKEGTLWEADLREVFAEIASELRGSRDPEEIAGRFHETVFRLSRDWIAQGSQVTGIRDVVLTGGVFQNQLLARRLVSDDEGFLGLAGIRLHEHHQVPPGDGGLAFGQAVIALERVHF